MTIGKILALSLVGAVIVGWLGGHLVGRMLRKRRSPDYKPLLNRKELLLGVTSLVIGVTLIVVGTVVLPKQEGVAMEGEAVTGEETPGENYTSGGVAMEGGGGTVIMVG